MPTPVVCRKPRLLALVPDPGAASDQAGGILSATRHLLGPALAEKYDIHVVDTSMRAFPPLRRWERIRGAVGRMARTVKELLSWRPDVAVAFCSAGPSYYEKSLCLCLAKLGGARTFLSPRSGYQVSWLEGSAWARRWLVASQRFIDGFLMQSRYWRDFHVRLGIRPEKTHIWFNSIDLDAWAPLAEERRPGGDGRPFRFLFLAWAIVEKGLPELIEATAILNAEGGPAFEVAVAGDGLFGRELMGRRESGAVPNNVHLLGWVLGDRRTAELRAADALVLPTWFEGFPNVVLEAMACALPVISTPVGAIEEVVADGRTGLLVPVRSPAKLARAMDRLRRDPVMAHAMGRHGRDLVRERFDRRQAVERFAEIIAHAPGSPSA